MGMFDEYEPDPTIPCPSCGLVLSGWQGKDGPCCLLRWHQHRPTAASTELAGDSVSLDRLASFRLPSVFCIYTECACKAWMEAMGFCDEGVWARTVLGRAVAARHERYFVDEPGRRRCGTCGGVWVADPKTLVMPCPACGVATYLAP
jgi:hypothetical protein